MWRRMWRAIGFLVIAWTVYTLALAFIQYRKVENAEEKLEAFLKDPGIASIDLYREPKGHDITFEEVLTGKLLRLPPLQLMVDFEMWSPEYWKPFHAISREVLWSSDMSPRRACEAVRAGLDIEERCQATERSNCLKGHRSAGMNVRPCYRLYEGGYMLPDDGNIISLDDETIGSIKFKRGGYREFGSPQGQLTEVPERYLTIIQVFAEATDI